MAVIHKTGDIFESDAEVIGHGVNLQGVMGAGIAKTVKELYPSVYEGYKQAVEFGALGAGGTLILPTDDGDLYIANIASQVKTGANADLNLLESGLMETVDQMRDMGLYTLALPRIGAGIGGLDWEDVLDIIESEAEVNPDFTIEVWTYEG